MRGPHGPRKESTNDLGLGISRTRICCGHIHDSVRGNGINSSCGGTKKMSMICPILFNTYLLLGSAEFTEKHGGVLVDCEQCKYGYLDRMSDTHCSRLPGAQGIRRYSKEVRTCTPKGS